MHARSPKRSKLRSTERVRRHRAREKIFERCATIVIGPEVISFLIDKRLLNAGDLENRQRLGKACERALKIVAGVPMERIS